MNAIQPPERDAVSLVELVDFKWLMSAEGLAVHVERLQQEPAYAQKIFATAAASNNQVLRRIGAALQQRLVARDPAT
jgi:hypothetical protein